MRRGLSKYIFLGTVLFIMLCILASPISMGETMQPFDVQDYNEDMPDMIKEFSTSAIETSNVVRVEEHVTVTGASTGNISLGATFTQSKTFYMWSMRPDTNLDDDDAYSISLHWKDSDELTWNRASASNYDFVIVIWLVEFTSGIEVWELGPFTSPRGAQNIGDTVVMADTFVINNGYSDSYIAHDDDWPVVYLLSTTQIYVETMYAGSWANHYVQVVEGADLTVQHGSVIDPDTNPIDITVTATTIARTHILLQSSTNDATTQDYACKAHLSDTTSLIIDRYDTFTPRDYFWQLVEWPEGIVDIQHVADTIGSADTTENATITEVDTGISVIFFEGTYGASQMGGYFASSGDEYGDKCMTAEFASSTSVTVTKSFSGDAIEYYLCIIVFIAPNSAPVNDQTPVCTNLDDTDNLYARYKIYNFSVSVTDADGATDTNYVELSSMNGATPVWTVKYLESDNSFSETAGPTLIELTGSVYTKSGVNLDIWFGIRIEWAHADANDYDLKQYVVDDAAASDTDTYSAIDYDYDTDVVTTFTLDDGSGTADHGNYDSIDSITANGTVSYEDSGGNNYPPTGDVDVHINCSDIAGQPWTDTTLSSGVWSVTVDSDDATGTDTYWVYVVAESGGFSGTQYNSTSVYDEYIADALTITITGPTDNRQNLNANATGIIVSAVYDEGGAFDGTLTLNNTDYNGDGTAVRWDYMVDSASGDTYGVTSISTNDDTYMIWDSITITITGPTDNRQNLNANATGIIVSAIYDYDSEAFDGTFTLNNTDYNGDGTAVRWDYTVDSVTGDTHGITTISSNDDTYMIWDSLTITITGPTDNRQNLNANASGIIVSAVRDYDSSAFDGTLTLNNTDYNGDGTAVRWDYTVDLPSGGTYGITTISSNDDTYMIWDSYTISFTVDDNRININVNATVGYTVISDYDSIAYDGTVNLNYTTWTQATAQRQGVTVSSLGGDDTYVITSISTNDDDYVIWDSLTVSITNPTDQRININANASGMVISAVYDYDSTTYDGTLNLNDTDYDRATAIRAGYKISSADGDDTHGITVISDDSDETYCVWDSLTITITGPTDNRQNLNANASGIGVSAIRDYDSSAFDGTFTFNATDWDGDGTVVRWGWTISSVSGGEFGITTIGTNDDTYMIWDQIKVLGYSTNSTDNHDNINDGVNITVWIQYDYDDTNVTDGTIVINGDSYAYNAGSGNWTAIFSNATASSATWNTAVAAGNTHGITSVNQNSKSLTFKWDSLTIVMGDPTDQRQNLNANASGIVVSATYDLGGAYDGTLGLNNTDYNGDGTVVRWGYEVDTANGDDTYGITAISDNSDTTYMIWDRIIILTTTTDDSRIDINTAAAIAATAKLEYDNHALGTGDALYMNGTEMSWNGSHFTLAPNFAVVDIWNFFVNSSSANEATYGITLINLDSNNVNQIWDSLTVTITNPTDQRININANASGMVLSAIWDYDSETYDGTLALNDTTYDYGSVGIYYYTVTAGDGDDTYGITVVSSSDSVYCIFDRILILTTTSTDSRIDYGTTTTVNVTAELEYDSHTLGTDDTLYMNGTEMTWDTDHFYLITGDYNIADIINYFVNSTSANEDTYGITVINLDGNDDDVIWDAYTVAFTVDDNRININTNATVGYTVISDYDSIAYDGTVNLNYTTWEQATAQRQGFTVSSLGGDDTYGITVIGTNDDDYVIWDSLTVTITGPTDNRQNLNANASGIEVSAVYDYDSNTFDGTFTLNNTDYNGDGTAVRWDYTVQSVTGDTYGITTISTNDDTYMIWDSYTISFTVDDNRIDINVNATVGYTVLSDYDSIAYDGTVNLNYTTWEQVSVQRQGFTVSSLGGDDTYDITSISTNDDDYLIWDAIGINMWIDDGRDNIDDTITVYAWLTYIYDMTNATDGTVLLNGTGMSYGDSIWSLGRSQSTAGLWAYNITSISGNTHGITVVGSNIFDDASTTYVNFGSAGFDMQEFITVSAWVQIIKYPATGTIGTIVEKGNQAVNTHWWLGIYNHTSHIDIFWELGNGTTRNSILDPWTPTINQWYHITGTYNTSSGLAKVYVNGVLLYSEDWGFDVIGTNALNLDVGIYREASHKLDGSVSSVRIYNRTLGINEIYELYQGRYSDNSDLLLDVSMVGWDVEDDVWYDKSGNGNDGNTVVGVVIEEFVGGIYVRPIWDSYTVSFTVDDNRININDNATVGYTVISDYDSIAYDGTITLNYTTWEQATFQRQGFTVSSLGGDDTYGITAIGTNDDDYIIWDEIEVYYGTVSDARTNFNEQEWPLFRLRLKYDSHLLNDGTNDAVYINSSVATWSAGDSSWYKYYTQGSVGIWNFLVTSVSEDTYGITAFDSASAVTYDQDIIWDRVIVMGYTTNSTDNRDNINDCFNVSVWIQYEYDSTNVTDGTIVINGDSFAYNAGSGNWTALFSNATASDATWDTIVASGNTYGITYENQNGKSQTVIWDRVQVQTTVVDDGRVNYGTSAQVRVILWLDYDDSYLGSGDTVNLNGTGMSWDAGNSWFELDRTFSVVGEWNFYVNSTSEATYGITALDLNGNSVNVIWDRILILTTAVTDGRINYGLDNTTLNVTARLEYEGGGTHNLGSGDTLYMNDTLMTWDTDHFYLVTSIYSIVDIINYFVNSSSANEATYGITVVNLDSNNADVIWDRIKILTTTATDGRIDYGTNTMINVTAELEYDSHGLGSGDTLYMNGTSMTWDTDHFYLTTGSYSIVDLINYFVNSSNANEVTHGITVINLDGNNADVIWDRIKITATVATDGRIDYGTTITLNVTAELEYDSHALVSGDTLYMNDTLMTWDTDHFYLVTGAYNIVDIIGYYVNSTSANEVTYGITVINLDGNDASVIWDRIKILTTTVTDGRIDYGTSTTVNVTAELEYDGHGLTSGDTLYMNGTSMTWDTDHFYLTTGAYNIIDIINYFVNSSSANEATYTITVVNVDGNSDDVIWDRIKIISTTTDDGRIGYNTQAVIAVTAQLEYDYHILGSGDTLYMNDTAMTWNGSHFILNPQFTNVNIWNFYVNSSNANEATYGIAAINLNGKSANQIWDRVAFTWNANMTWTIVNYNINVSFTAIHEYDSATFVGNLTAGNCTITNSTTAYEILTESPYENYTYYTTSVIDDVYGITAYINTVVAWCVFDNITATESHGITVTDYSKTFFIYFGELQWQYNGSNIGIDWICLNIRNGTQTTTAITLADSVLSPIKQEIYVPIDWNGVLYSNNATKTIGGRSYNFQWYSIEHSVMASQTIVVESTRILDNTLVISGTTNVDFTWYIYDDGSPTGETDSVSDANDFKIEFDRSIIYGWRNYSIYFDAGLSGNRWYNSSYFNNFDLNIEIPEQVDDNMEIKGISNVDCEWYVYNRDTTTWTGENDTISGGNNYFQFLFLMQTASGKHNYSLYFNVSAVVFVWRNGSYYIAPILLTISNPVYTATDEQNFLSGETNVGCDWYAYNNDTEMDNGVLGAGSFAIGWAKNTTAGYYVWGIKFDDGTTTRWVNGTFEVGEVVFLVTDYGFDFTDDLIVIRGTPNKDGTSTLYHNNGVVGGGGNFYEDTIFIVTWTRSDTVGTHNMSLKCVSGADTQWINGSYYVPPAITETLAITGLSYSDAGENITFYWNTNWFNTTGQFYYNDVAKGSAVNEGTTLSFAAPTSVGNYNVSIKIYGGDTTLWINHTYTVSENPMYLITSSIDTTGAIVSAYAETNWNNATITVYENDVQKDTDDEGVLLSYTKATSVGEYNVSLKIDGGGTVLWFNVSYSIAPLDPMYLLTYGIDTTGATVTGYAETNWNNATLTIYENDAQKDTGAEGTLLAYAKNTTAGEYNVGLKIDGGGTVSWVNVSYTIEATPMYLTSVSISTTGATVTGYAETSWNNATLIIYENDAQKDTGAEGSLLSYAKSTAVGDYDVGLRIDGGATVIWFNVSYSIAAEEGLYLTGFLLDTSGYNISAFATTNWGNTTLTLYENDAQKDTRSEGTALSYTKASSEGNYNVSLKVDGGGTVIWVNTTYVISAPAVLTISDTVYTATSEHNYLGGYASDACSWYAYNNNTEMDTGSIIATGSFQVDWVKNITVGVYIWGVKFTDGTTTRWINGTFEVELIALTYSNVIYFPPEVENQVSGIISVACNYSVFENNTYVAVARTALSAGAFSITWDMNSSIGLIKWAIKFNTTLSTIWFNGSYYVANTTLTVTDYLYTHNTEQNYLSGQVTVACTYYVYENQSQVGTGPLIAGSFSIPWGSNSSTGILIWGVKFVDGVTTVWVNGSYYNAPIVEDELGLMTALIESSGVNISILMSTNWLNTTVYVYEDDVLQNAGGTAEGNTIIYPKATSHGNYSIGIKVDGTAQSIWFNFTYQVVPDDDMYLTSSMIDTAGYNISAFATTNWGNATLILYENDISKDSGSEGITLSYVKAMVAGNYNVSLKVDGGTTIMWLNTTYAVEAEADLAVGVIDFDINGLNVTVFVATNWANTTVTIYEDDLSKVSGDEGTSLSYVKSVAAGNYRVGIKIDGTADSLWVNYTYSITAEDALTITAISFDSSGINVTVYVNTNWGNATITVYEDDNQKVTGSEGSLSYIKTTGAGDYNVGVKVDGGGTIIWANYTYSVVVDALSITTVNFGITGANVTAFATTNWLNTTLTIYENNVQKDTGNEGTTLSYVRAVAAGDYYIGLKIDGGTSIIWVNNTYTITAEDGLSLVGIMLDTSGYNVSAFATTNWGNTTLTLYENDVQKVSGNEGITLSYAKATAAGSYNVSLKIDGTGDVMWVNTTYMIAVTDIDIDIEAWSAEDVVIEITGISNLDIAWYVYNEGIYSEESGTETGGIGFHFTFAKNINIGKHNFSVYFNDTVDGSQGRWFNKSYTISAVYGYCQISLYNSEGTGLDVNHFIVYVNGTRYYGNEFYDRIDYTYNITVTDYFGYVIYSNTLDYDRHLDVGIAFYVYKVQSELQGQEVYFNLTRTGGARFSQHLLPDEILTYYLVAGEYTYEFRKVAHDMMAPTYIYYEGTFTLSTDKTHIIDGTNLRDLENDIELIPAGKTNIEPLETAMSGVMSMISMMQLGMWGLAFLIVIGMAATATEDEITKDGKVIKKRKIPKQLKRFAFKRGAKNPKSKSIPKGAGRRSWKGVPFRDEVKDWRDKM